MRNTNIPKDLIIDSNGLAIIKTNRGYFINYVINSKKESYNHRMMIENKKVVYQRADKIHCKKGYFQSVEQVVPDIGLLFNVLKEAKKSGKLKKSHFEEIIGSSG